MSPQPARGSGDHPEATCNRCGQPNPVWVTPDHEAWQAATRDLRFDVVEILCPSCFVALWEANTGQRGVWYLTRTEPVDA